MRTALIFTLFALPALTAAADERAAFYGIWGTEKQCARAPLAPDVPILAEPFEIKGEWLRRGQIWCRLSWFPIDQRQNGVFTGAFALCGEDGPREYFVRMTLKDEELTIRWDFTVTNGPLSRCPTS